MNVITRGMRGALRSPVRSGSIIAILAISIGLILAMLVARASVEAKINEVKASTATTININPAGISGGMGGGDLLTAAQLADVKSIAHIESTNATLTQPLDSDKVSLEAALELGGNAKFMMRNRNGTETTGTPPIIATGTSDPAAVITSSQLTSGSMIKGDSSEYVALVGKTLAKKNNLSVGSAFTAYDKTFTVKGIYSTDNKFQDSNMMMPLETIQTMTNQAGQSSSITAIVDSSDNVASVTAALKSKLGDTADISSQLEEAENSLEPLKSISGLALAGVIGASIAAASIILLAMIMIVRERRREIGVIKAIGGSNVKVITQFITEGMTLTFIGGIIGIGLGIAVSGPMTQSLVSSTSETPTDSKEGSPRSSAGGRMEGLGPRLSAGPIGKQLSANFQKVTSTLTPETITVSIGIVVLIAIIGSAAPAWAIARVRPAEVLRTE